MPRQRQQAAQNTGFNSAACAVELHEPARVDEPVHDSRRHLVVVEHGHPLAELYVGRGGRAYCRGHRSRGHRLYRLRRRRPRRALGATSPGTPSANLIEMDRSYYASIEVGRRNVSLSNLKKIADGFHITISELMRGVE